MTIRNSQDDKEKAIYRFWTGNNGSNNERLQSKRSGEIKLLAARAECGLCILCQKGSRAGGSWGCITTAAAASFVNPGVRDSAPHSGIR
jgi:hypothetical protein